MRVLAGQWNVYADLRTAAANEQLSLDLSRHLPCRLMVGGAIIVADNPRIFCSVLRRRWSRIIREVEMQRCLTLDPLKRRLLAREQVRLQRLQFTSKLGLPTDVLVVPPEREIHQLPHCTTLYIAASLGDSLADMLTRLSPGGLVVVYRDFWEEFEHVIQESIRQQE